MKDRELKRNPLQEHQVLLTKLSHFSSPHSYRLNQHIPAAAVCEPCPSFWPGELTRKQRILEAMRIKIKGKECKEGPRGSHLKSQYV